MNITDRIKNNANISVRALEEPSSIADSFEDHATIDYVTQLAEASIWGWCCVQVTVQYMGIRTTECLCESSYTDETEFRECTDYNDMVDRCVSDIACMIMSIVRTHNESV